MVLGTVAAPKADLLAPSLGEVVLDESMLEGLHQEGIWMPYE